jgi:LPXTG-motif cell wall-anchored protein
VVAESGSVADRNGDTAGKPPHSVVVPEQGEPAEEGGPIVRNAVRKLIGVAMIGALGAIAAAPMLSASAQEGGPPPSPGACSFSVAPTTVDSFPADVVVSGTAPIGVHVQLFENGGTTPIQTQDTTDGTFSFNVTVTGPTTFAVNYTFGAGNAYTTGCSTVAGEVVQRVVAPTVAPAQVHALAFTGSSNTPSYVLIGVAAVMLGIVLVVAARRRSHLS